MIISIIMLVTGVVLTGGYVTVNRVSGLRVAAAIEQHVFPPDASLAHIVVYLDEWLPRLQVGELHYATSQALRRAKIQELRFHRDEIQRIVPVLAREHTRLHCYDEGSLVPLMGLNTIEFPFLSENDDSYRERTPVLGGNLPEHSAPILEPSAVRERLNRHP